MSSSETFFLGLGMSPFSLFTDCVAGRTAKLPSSILTKSTLSPGPTPSASRTSLGSVNCPLEVSVAAVMAFLTWSKWNCKESIGSRQGLFVHRSERSSIKLATHSPMHKRMEDDMEVNCGTVLDGQETVQQCGQRIFDLMLKLTSGQPTTGDSLDFGGAEFAPWVLGATM